MSAHASHTATLRFLKMHGLGNDFVVVDGRLAAVLLTGDQYRAIGDRRRGVGYDQFLTILPPRNGGGAYMAIHNPDGSEAQACGNGTRCVAALLMAETGTKAVVIETVAGQLDCRQLPDGRVTVDMGPANADWTAIPLAEALDTTSFAGPGAEGYGPATAVNIGNPHIVFFVANADAIDLATIGPPLEHHPLFPERANIEFVTVRDSEHLRMRVWERGAGITQACGSGACAALVAAARRGFSSRHATIELDGGALEITWRDDGHVEMTGPVATSFSGALDLSTLG